MSETHAVMTVSALLLGPLVFVLAVYFGSVYLSYYSVKFVRVKLLKKKMYSVKYHHYTVAILLFIKAVLNIIGG